MVDWLYLTFYFFAVVQNIYGKKQVIMMHGKLFHYYEKYEKIKIENPKHLLYEMDQIMNFNVESFC